MEVGVSPSPVSVSAPLQDTPLPVPVEAVFITEDDDRTFIVKRDEEEEEEDFLIQSLLELD